MSLEKNIDLIVTGETFCVTLVGIENNNDTVTATNVIVTLTIPDGIEFLSANSLPRGSYNPGTKIWTIGNLLPNEVLDGEFCFTITDSCEAPYQIYYNVSSVDACEDDLSNNLGCITVQGLSCCALGRCEGGELTTNNVFVVPDGATDFPIDVSTNDDPCADMSLPTYEWSDLSLLNGTLNGLPDNAQYTPDADFCGMSIAEYKMYCNGNLQGTGTVLFYVSCANPENDLFYGADGVTFQSSVANNDKPCNFGASTSYHLVSDEAANGTVSQPTSEGSVTVTEWNQSTGDVTIVPTAGWAGTATFQYFIRCTSGGVSTDSNSVTVSYVIEPNSPDFPWVTISDSVYNLNGSEHYILIDNSSNAVALMASAADFEDGVRFTKKVKIKCLHDPGGFGASITNTLGDIVDNTIPASAPTNYLFSSIGESIEIMSDGTDFYVFR